MGIPFFGKKGKSTEQLVSDALLSGGVSVTLGSKEYNAPAPTLATWIEVSALVTNLSDGDMGDVSLYHLMSLGTDAETYARILATFIAGVQKSNSKERESLYQEIVHSASVQQVTEALYSILEIAKVQGLFMLTTSLKQTSITKPTMEVVNKTTAPGLE